MFVTDCPINIFGRGNKFYVLSDDQTNATNAWSVCRNSGGILAEIDDITIQSDFIRYSVLKHIPSG